jgi:ornithine carbamoyltransferase
VLSAAEELAFDSGARIMVTEDVAEATAGADFIYTDVWLSMGEPVEAWGERIRLLLPYQVTTAVLEATGNPDVKFMHCLPALHDGHTEVGAQLAASIRAGRAGGHRRRLRVTSVDRVRSGREPPPHHQGHHGRHPGGLR